MRAVITILVAAALSAALTACVVPAGPAARGGCPDCTSPVLWSTGPSGYGR